MSVSGFLAAASLLAVPPASGVGSGPSPFFQAPLAVQALDAVRGSGFPIVGIDQAAASIRTATIPLREAPRPADALREVTDNWLFHEGADLIFASMADGPQGALREPSQSDGTIEMHLQIGSLIK